MGYDTFSETIRKSSLGQYLPIRIRASNVSGLVMILQLSLAKKRLIEALNVSEVEDTLLLRPDKLFPSDPCHFLAVHAIIPPESGQCELNSLAEGQRQRKARHGVRGNN